MFARMVVRSLLEGRSRFALAWAAVVIPSAIVTATANFALDAEEKMTRELRTLGPNVLLEVRRGVPGMDPAEVERARGELPGILGTATVRTDRMELSVSGSYDEIDRSLGRINGRSRTLKGRPIPVIAAREGLVLGRLRGLLTMISGLVLGASGLAMAMALAASVAERRSEIGLLRALGATGPRVVGFFAAQVGVLLALGLGVGAAAGVALSSVMSRGVFGLPAQLRPEALGVALVGCGVMGLVASIVPVRRALGIQPALVLKGE